MAIYKLGDIATINMCKRVLSKQTSKVGEIPFYKIGTFGGVADSFIERNLYNELKKYRFPEKGDSLISASGTIGKIVEYDGRDAFFQDSNIVWITSNKFLKKYFNFWLQKMPFLPTQGATIKRLYNSDISNTSIELPSISEQQKIIDIIKQNEHLFLSHSKCVRIDTANNTAIDMKNIIDIIKPIESLKDTVTNLKEILKNLLIKQYDNIHSSITIKLSNVMKLENIGYENQDTYFATNAIGECSIDFNKAQLITINNKPSRANITPKKGSIILSKLDGENKLLYFGVNSQYVFSTGFFNIKTNFVDELMGYFLSDDFKSLKTKFSTGTTMTGLSNETLSILPIKELKSHSSELSNAIYELIMLESRVTSMMNKLIKLLIK